MHPFIRMIRPLNVAMSAVAVLTGAWAFNDWVVSTNLLATALIWAVFIAGANMINDSFDFRIDMINHPDRPIPQGEVTPEKAFICGNLLFLPGLWMAMLMGTKILILVVGCIFLVYFYERLFKSIGLLGNVTIGLLVASGFVAGGIIADNLPIALIIGLFAYLATTGREVVKDMEDRKGDYGRASVVWKWGGKWAVILAGIFFGSPVILAILVYYPLGHGAFLYLIFILLSGIAFLVATISVSYSPSFSQRSAKLGMVLALAAFLFG